jgi:hypothetical protein
VLFGLLWLVLAFWALRKKMKLGEQNKPGASAKILPAVFALLGIGLIVGGVIYGQTRLKQIDEEYATKRSKSK